MFKIKRKASISAHNRKFTNWMLKKRKKGLSLKKK